MSENEYLCPDCGKPMTLAPGIDYFCKTPECTKKARAQFAADLRQSYQESDGWKTRDEIFAELEEARGRIAELESAGKDILKTARLLYANSEQCVIQHHESSEQPPWLRDCEFAIAQARVAIEGREQGK